MTDLDQQLAELRAALRNLGAQIATPFLPLIRRLNALLERDRKP